MKGQNSMTKQEANKIKKVLKSENVKHTPYFKSETGELRIQVIKYNTPVDGDVPESLVIERMASVLNALSKNGLKPKYRKDRKVISGYIDYRFLVFE